jgi:UTP--glucose-1-phosphate uridylyltransferase
MTSRKVKKAVITAAGFSTRFLPTTKTVPKEMIPILETPTIEYIIDELDKSGIESIIFVTKRGSNATEDYFDTVEELESSLEKAGKFEYLERVRRLNKKAHSIAYVRQDKTLPYGNASPLISAKSFIGDEPFIYLYCDDLVVGDVPASKELIDMYENTPDADAVVIVQGTTVEDMHKYGIAKIKPGTNNVLDQIIEKPGPEQNLLPLASFGRYVLSPSIFNYLDRNATGLKGELWFVDALNRYSVDNKIYTKEVSGKWYTTGDPLNMFKLTLKIASERPEYKAAIQDFIKSL